MIEANIKIITTVSEFILSSIEVSSTGIKGVEAQSHKQIKEIPMYEIVSVIPYQMEVVGTLCLN